jgi:hypothetical protein
MMPGPRAAYPASGGVATHAAPGLTTKQDHRHGHGPQLYVVAQEWGGLESAEPTGQIVVFPAPAPGAGKP